MLQYVEDFKFGATTELQATVPHPTVEALLAAYCRMTPAERVHFGREIGVNRVWQPKQRRPRDH